MNVKLIARTGEYDQASIHLQSWASEKSLCGMGRRPQEIVLANFPDLDEVGHQTLAAVPTDHTSSDILNTIRQSDEDSLCGGPTSILGLSKSLENP
jgi:hypothetical protein